MKNKRLLYTFLLSISLFLFLGICIYSLYCFAYHNRHQEIVYIDNINKRKYDFLYNHLSYTLTEEDFAFEMTLLFDKTCLETIYNDFYKGKELYSSLEAFLDTYYFGNTITNKDVTFKKEGRTSFFSRRKLYYDTITLESKNGVKTKLGLYQNITFQIDEGATLKIDEKELMCPENNCQVEEMLGGLHTLIYKVGNITYYGLFTINKNDSLIHVSTLDSLVVINKEVFTLAITPLKYGDYIISGCYLEDKHYCPATTHSYIKIKDKEHFAYYTYVSYSKAGDYCEGTYQIDGRFIALTCDTHIHKVFDYDTQVGTDVITKTEVKYAYKISNENTIENRDYQWTLYN